MQPAESLPTIDADRVANITAAFARVTSSLRELANNRNEGPDLIATLATMLGGGGPTPSIPAPSDADLTARSHDLIDALDRGDLEAVEAALAPDFLVFEGGSPRDRESVIARITQRTAMTPYIAKRSWDAECVTRKGDALVFTGMAHEVQGGNDSHGGYLYDGWYFLRWVRCGDAWRVQLLTWQKASTEREVWNETFQMDRGFSKEPNRLLVETVANMKPGAALELAMGQGRNALHLASKGWRVTGVDSSDEALRISREQATARGLELETVLADIDEWAVGESRFDLVTLFYAGDHGKWLEKIRTSLRTGGLVVVEGWAKQSPESPSGFGEGQLAKLFADFEILRDETVEDVPDWAFDKGKLVRFVARRR